MNNREVPSKIRSLASMAVLLLGVACGGGGGTGGGGATPGTAGGPPAPPPLAVPATPTATAAEKHPQAVLVKFRPSVEAIPDLLARRLGYTLGDVQRFPSFEGLRRLEVRGVPVDEAVRRLNAQPEVEYAEPDYVVHASEAVPNDPWFTSQWGLRNTGQEGGTAGADVGATRAWDRTMGTPEVVVGVLDSGVDYRHPDLAPNMWRNPGETAGNGVDDDANGIVDDVFGYDALEGDGDPMDAHSHGTHVAGILAAAADNGQGVAGVAPRVRIMALRFLDENGDGYTSDAIHALDYALRHGVRITNNSWGGGASSQSLRDAIVRARNAGMLFVAAAGNDGADLDTEPSYPASYGLDNMIVVGSSTRTDSVSSFSNTGAATVHLFAPGSSIASTMPKGGYAYKSGTSMATPFVAGAAALLLSQNPYQDYLQVRDRLLGTVDPRPAYSGRSLTGGRLNVDRALGAAPEGVDPQIASVSPSSAPAGSEVTLAGSGFGYSRGRGTVAFTGASQATVLSWSDTALRVRVPSFAQSGPVVVTTDSGRTSNGLAFTVLAMTGGRLALPSGWSLVSMPVREVTSARLSASSGLYRYDGQRYLSLEPTEARPGQGYWVNGSGTLEYQGVVNTDVRTVDLAPGWNLVGLPLEGGVEVEGLRLSSGEALPRSVSSATSTPADSSARVFRWAFEHGPAGYQALDLAAPGARLETGKGYWIWSWDTDRLGF